MGLNGLFRSGGWALKLEGGCDNPTLVSFLSKLEGLRQATCAVLGVKCERYFQDTCHQVTPRLHSCCCLGHAAWR